MTGATDGAPWMFFVIQGRVLASQPASSIGSATFFANLMQFGRRKDPRFIP